jgi:citrate synthase
MSNFAELKIDGKSFNLPLIEGSEKERGIDISSLRAQTGLVTMDPGFKNTGSTKSAITFLDGEEGVLKYRGYSIEELAEKSSFLEVAYLLIYGKLPSANEFDNFSNNISQNAPVNESAKTILSGFPKSAHPMGMLSALFAALTAFYPESLNPNASEEEVNKNIIRAIAQVPVISAWSHRHKTGQTFINPDNKLDYCGNFLKMMFAKANGEYEVDPIVSKALDQLLILHADHEQNCSTSTVRIVGSSHASLYSSLSAGVNALWGPLHGGANQAVIEMLEAIKADGGDTKKFIEKAKDKNDPFRLMGFGHRVYKNFDPRAKIIKKAADSVLGKMGIQDPILDIAKGLEEAALNDEYFIARKLYPNVDFYSGIIYRAMGIPTEMFTVMFAIGRLPGWIAQWKEMRENNDPIGRPRQIYTGDTKKNYVDIKNR